MMRDDSVILNDLEEIRREFPRVRDRITAEYRRLGGFLPYEQGYVYAIHAVGTRYYKIGKTTDPDRRILQIAPKMPFGTQYVKLWRSDFMSMAERWMHGFYQKERTNGEWFEFSDSYIEAIFGSAVQDHADQIRFAYCDEFLSRITRDRSERGEFYEFFTEREEDNIYFGLDGGTSDFMGWIQDCFLLLDHHDLPTSESILEKRGNCYYVTGGDR